MPKYLKSKLILARSLNRIRNSNQKNIELVFEQQLTLAAKDAISVFVKNAVAKDPMFALHSPVRCGLPFPMGIPKKNPGIKPQRAIPRRRHTPKLPNKNSGHNLTYGVSELSVEGLTIEFSVVFVSK